VPYNSNIHHRRSIRLLGHDYTRSGPYFLTICTHDRALILNDPRIRDICTSAWRFRLHLLADPEPWDFVVMPNHVHGVAWLPGRGAGAQHEEFLSLQRTSAFKTDDGRRYPGEEAAPLQQIGPTTGPLADFVGSFKSLTARRMNLLRRSSGAPVWQRNYYEHIIRNDDDLARIREYILSNPGRWNEDPENPMVPLARG
jgi:REP element-mobilizing transposase RayT